MERDAEREGSEQPKSWWTREHVQVLVLLGATVVGLALCYLLAQPFLPALAWALALAVVAHPAHAWILQRVRHENFAAVLAVALVAVIVVAPSIFVIQRLVQEVETGVEAFSKGLETGEWKKALERKPRLRAMAEWVEKQVRKDEGAQQAATAASHASTVLTGSVRGGMQLLITFFILFYFFRDQGPVLQMVRSLLPLTNPETDQLFSRVRDTIYATIYGTLVVAMVQGTLGGLMFWWLGLPAPLLWGVVMGLLAIVPVLAAFVVWLPAAAVLALQGAMIKALILAVWGLVVISLIDNFLYPVLVGKRLRLHTVPVFIAIVGGLVVFGASGVVLGPVVLAITIALLNVWRRRTHHGGAADKPAAVPG